MLYLRICNFNQMRALKGMVFSVAGKKRSKYWKENTTIIVLCVAEKNDAAKNIASLLSRNGFNRREGISKFNKIYEYQGQFRGQNATFVMTSASGHLMNYEFESSCKNWGAISPQTLFHAKINKCVTKGIVFIFKNISQFFTKLVPCRIFVTVW